MAVRLEEGLNTYDDAEAKALARFSELELDLPTKPPKDSRGRIYDGRVPLNLQSLTPHEIGEIYALQTTYTDYVAAQAVLARAEMTSASEKLDLVRAAVRRSKTGTVQEKADLALIDERYVEANAAYIEARTYYELIAAVEAAAARDSKFISRIIETKRLEMEMGFRGNSVGRVPDGERPGARRFRSRER